MSAAPRLRKRPEAQPTERLFADETLIEMDTIRFGRLIDLRGIRLLRPPRSCRASLSLAEGNREPV